MQKIKVLLIKPYFDKYFVKFLPNYEPLALLILAGAIKDIAEVKILDMRFERKSALAKTIKSFKPDIVGTRTHTIVEMFTCKNFLKKVKDINPSITTIIGGQHTTLMPEDFFEPFVDLICIGPGEKVIRQVAEAKANGQGYKNINGLVVNEDGSFVKTEPQKLMSGLFKWPEIDRSLIKKYMRHFHHGFTFTSMGCPNRCSFCSLWVTAQGTYRLRDPKEIVDDLKKIKQKMVYIGDDNTFSNIKHAMEIYDLIKVNNIKKKYIAYARTNTIIENEKVFRKWKEIGLKILVVGMEAVDDKHLETINKQNTAQTNINAQRILNDIGIINYAHFIIFPEFTKQDFDNIWKFIEENNIAFPYFVPLTPQPGTQFFKEARSENKLSISNYSFYNLIYMVMRTDMSKWDWYKELLRLWGKSSLPTTMIRRRMAKKIPMWDYLIRTLKLTKVIPQLFINYHEQLSIEAKGFQENPLPSFNPDHQLYTTFKDIGKTNQEIRALEEALGEKEKIPVTQEA